MPAKQIQYLLWPRFHRRIVSVTSVTDKTAKTSAWRVLTADTQTRWICWRVRNVLLVTIRKVLISPGLIVGNAMSV